MSLPPSRPDPIRPPSPTRREFWPGRRRTDVTIRLRAKIEPVRSTAFFRRGSNLLFVLCRISTIRFLHGPARTCWSAHASTRRRGPDASSDGPAAGSLTDNKPTGRCIRRSGMLSPLCSPTGLDRMVIARVSRSTTTGAAPWRRGDCSAPQGRSGSLLYAWFLIGTFRVFAVIHIIRTGR